VAHNIADPNEDVTQTLTEAFCIIIIFVAKTMDPKLVGTKNFKKARASAGKSIMIRLYPNKSQKMIWIFFCL